MIKMENNIIPLAFMASGERGEIVGIRGGQRMAKRLYGMGLTPNSLVEVIVSNPAGPILINIRGSRVAIGRGMAMKILVRRL